MGQETASLQGLLAELERIDLLIRIQVWRTRQLKRETDPFEGLYIPEEEIDAILGAPRGMPRWAGAPLPAPEEELVGALERVSRELAARRAACAASGVRLRLDELRASFGLGAFDADVLLITLAPEIDLRYERVFAYLQDDVTRRRPSVDLVLNLLCRSLEEKLAMRERLSPRAPLIRHGIIELAEDASRPEPPLLGRPLRVNERIVRFLFGSDEADATVEPCVRRARPGAELPLAPPEVLAALDIATAHMQSSGRLLVRLFGPRGAGKKMWAEALCARLGLGLLIIDVEKVLDAKALSPEATLRCAAREAVLLGAAPYWDRADALLPDARRAARDTLAELLAEQPGLGFIAGAAAWERAASERGSEFPVLRVELPRPGHAERVRLWKRALGAPPAGELAEELNAIAGKFRFTGGEIQSAVGDVQRRQAGRAPTVAELYAACREQASRSFGELARKIRPCYTWSDLVLPAEATQQLHEICGRVRHRSRVFEEWGFDARLSLGKGISVLFSGQSGTGKTMAAEIMAGELGLELYRIDLSGVVSKYIGETEKNLSRIFGEAENSHAILFFDEADALFGKRSEVKDAHDRYANIETSYLLQQMEEYQGITILATNLRRNMDEAFMRRMTFSIVFPFPGEEERLRIWSGAWPAATPRRDDVDLPFLAKRFKLTGGNIKNIALDAAFLAAEEGSAVSMAHVVRAVRRELQKMGASCVPSEFEPYAGLLGEP